MPFIAPLIEVGLAAATAVGSFVAGSVIAQGLIMAGIGLAASYLINKLMPKPDANSDVSKGVSFERQYGSSIARTVPCGIVGIAGHDIYINTWDSSNDHCQQIYVLGDFPCAALNRVAVNGSYCDVYDGAFPLTAASGEHTLRPLNGDKWGGLIKIQFFDGTQTVTPSALVGAANPPTRWNSNNVGVGVAFVLITMIYDQDNNASFPDFFFELKGAKLYDWRKDSTVSGGSGSHRWADITTYEFSENPIVAAYNYRRGFVFANDMFLGMGMSANDLPVDKWTTAANICDEADDTDLQARYRISVIFSADNTHSDNLQAVSTACGSMDIDTVEGSWPLVGSDQPSIITITDDAIDFTNGSFKWRALRSMSEIANSVTGNYPEPNQLWSPISYDGVVSDTYLALDRRTRDLNMNFDTVRWARQAAQLASIYFFENRYEGVATLPLGPRYQFLETGDWVTWQSDRYSFTKQFIITGKSLASLDSDKPRFPILTLQERSSDIYAGVEPTLPSTPVPPGVPVYMEEVQSFNAFAITMTGDDGKLLPAIRVSWLPIDDVTVTDVELIYYPVEQGVNYASYITVDATKSLVNVLGVVGNTDYFIAARIITDPPRSTVFNTGAGVTTPNVGTGNTYADLDQAIQDQLGKIAGEQAVAFEQFKTDVADLLANQDGRNWIDKKSVRSQLYATAGNARAQIEELQTVVVDNQTAFANYQVTVSASFDDVNASVTENTTAIATLDGYAAASYGIIIDVNGAVAGYELFNGGAGLSIFRVSSDTFQLWTPGGDKPIFATGLINGVAAVGFNADLTIDGSITAQMITVTSLSAISGNMGTLTVGKIQSTDNKMVIDATNKQIIFSD